MTIVITGANRGLGLEFARQLHAAGADLPAIVFTAFDTDERIVEAVRAGARPVFPAR